MKEVNLSKEQIDLYIKDHLLPQLSRDHASYHFEISDIGQRSIITYLTIEDFKPLVLKATKKKHKAEHMWEGTRHLHSHGIKAPEITHLNLSRKIFKRFGCYFVCEEKIEGKVFREFDNPMDYLSLVAENFVRLHHIKRAGWGRIDSSKRYRLWNYLKGTIKKKLKNLSSYKKLFSSKQCDHYLQWFTIYKDTISGYNKFSLSHCDPHMHNVMINDTREVYLLDVDALRYLPLSIDFYKLQYNFCQDDEEKTSKWQQEYLSRLSREELEEFNKSKDFFHCYVLLDFAQRGAYNLTHPKDTTKSHYIYPLSLKKTQALMDEITKG
jgi:hypothetical protein